MKTKATIEAINDCCFVAATRSGHHAIMHWILGNFYNKEFFFVNDYLDDNSQFKRSIKCGETLDLFMYNFEIRTKKLTEILTSSFIEQREKGIKSQKRTTCLVLRDPFNNFASQLKGYGNDVDYMLSHQNSINSWKECANAILDKRIGKTNIYPILYNEWFLDIEYRKKIINDLFGMDLNDKTFEYVPSGVGSSSFDGSMFNENTKKMGVLRRFKHYSDHIKYKTLFDDEICDLTKKIFKSVDDEFINDALGQ